MGQYVEGVFVTVLPTNSPSSADAVRPLGYALAWALGFALIAVTTVMALGYAILIMHAISYGAAAVFSPDSEITAPSLDAYGIAVAVSSTVALVGSAALVMAARSTRVRQWAPPLQGLVAAVPAGVLAVLTLLLLLDIDPLTLLG